MPSSSSLAPVVSSTAISQPLPSTETPVIPSISSSPSVSPSTGAVEPLPATWTSAVPSASGSTYAAPPWEPSSIPSPNTTSPSISTSLPGTTESNAPSTPTQVYETTYQTTWEQAPTSISQPSTFVTSVVSVTAPSPVPTSAQSYDDGDWYTSKYPEWNGTASATPRYRR
ncbi:hypothetical protein Ct61P_01637 [Colletotrichum tofieldiae]|nr:hypothetical protein Ct61P_01637 [Colletotrichum tofieldiae]